jgi:hypothetical protein
MLSGDESLLLMLRADCSLFALKPAYSSRFLPGIRRGGWRFTGGGFLGADRRSRRGGSGVDGEWGRLRRPGRRGKAFRGTGDGRRTTQGVPSPRNPTPAFTRVGFLEQIVLFVGVGVGWMWGGGPWAAQQRGSRQGHGQPGRRKRPLPTPHPPPPLRVRCRFGSDMIINLPL